MNNCELVTERVWACGENGKSIPSHSPITNAHTTPKYPVTLLPEDTTRGTKEDGVKARSQACNVHTFFYYGVCFKKKTC